MKEKTLSISEAQKEIINLPKQLVAGKLNVVAVTCDGKPTLAILSYEVYKRLLEVIDALQETLEICQDPEQMATLRNSLAELQLDKKEHDA
jgi:PHD/YefM family antitoxin component YafN of YafNO toxin-antitoxin module